MNKTVYALAALAVVSLASCNGKCGGGQCKNGDKIEVYTGIIPAADTDGIRYTLKLEYDDDHNYKKGDYELLETYFAADTTAVTGYKDVKSYTSEGDFSISDKTGKPVYKFVQDIKDSTPGSKVGPFYFVADTDSTLVMLNSDMEPAANPELYTLTLVK